MYILLHVNTCTNILKTFQRGTLLEHDDRQILAYRQILCNFYDYVYEPLRGVLYH